LFFWKEKEMKKLVIGCAVVCLMLTGMSSMAYSYTYTTLDVQFSGVTNTYASALSVSAITDGTGDNSFSANGIADPSPAKIAKKKKK
jgi:hypothetical protein